MPKQFIKEMKAWVSFGTARISRNFRDYTRGKKKNPRNAMRRKNVSVRLMK